MVAVIKADAFVTLAGLETDAIFFRATIGAENMVSVKTALAFAAKGGTDVIVHYVSFHQYMKNTLFPRIKTVFILNTILFLLYLTYYGEGL